MKNHALGALVALSVLIVIGCTACESDPSAATGLNISENLEILCCPTGWYAMEDTYSFNDGYETYDLHRIIIQSSMADADSLTCFVRSPSDDTFDAGPVTCTDTLAVVSLSQMGAYTLKITTRPDESDMVLSLTAADDGTVFDKLYFSLEGGA